MKITNPKLRFKDNNGNDFPDWETKKLGEVFTENKNTVGSRLIETYSISAGAGFISQLNKFGKDISGMQSTKYICLELDQFSYNKGSSKNYKYGCIYLNTLDKNISVPNVFISFKSSLPTANYFYAKLFEHHYLDNQLRALISSGARLDGLLNINKNSFFQMRVPYPSLAEQTKIANFISAIDEKINLLRQKQSLLTQYKKGLMQKLFSQQLRFKDDNGNNFPDWETKKLGELADVRDGTHESPKYIDKGYPFLTSKNLLCNGNIDFDNVNYISEKDYFNFNKRSNVSVGDILFGMIGTIGNPVIVFKDGFAIKNIALIKKSELVNNYFLYQFLRSSFIEKQFSEQNTGGTQKFIALGIIRLLIIISPSLAEQTKIANFLTTIDEKINLTAELIKQNELYKKGLMQQMFV